jgi:hypothetical protein
MTEKAFGWEVTVRFHLGSGKKDQTFHYRGVSMRKAFRRGIMKTNAVLVLSVDPVTKDQWLRAYGNWTHVVL